MRLNFRLHRSLTMAAVLIQLNVNPHYKLCFFNNPFNVFNLRSDLLPSVFATNTLSNSLLSRACHFLSSNFFELITLILFSKSNTRISPFYVTSFLLGPDILICFLLSDTLSTHSFLRVHFTLAKNTQYSCAFG